MSRAAVAPTVASRVAEHGGDAVRECLGLSARWVSRTARVTPEYVAVYEAAMAAGKPVRHPRLDPLYTALAQVWAAVQ